MPRTKKEGLSPAVGTLQNGARKSGNPDFVSSSFYVPKTVNNAFNRALLTLKDADFDVDRSDILAILMDRFSTAVEDAADSNAGLDMQTLIEGAAEGAAVTDTAGLNYLKEVRKAQIEETKKLLAEWDEQKEKTDAQNQKLMESYETQIAVLMQLIPEDVRGEMEKMEKAESSD